MRTARLSVCLAVLLWPAIVLAPAWPLGGLGAGEDDVLYYYPMRVVLAETVAASEWPWMNPWNGLGRPLAADPQTALWYPTTWLFAAARQAFGPDAGGATLLAPYAASLWLHYSLAAAGMYRLLRGSRLGRRAALLGGLVFAFGGFLLAHRAHLTMQHAGAWAPWVFWALRRYVFESPSTTAVRAGGQVGRLVLAAFILAMQSLAGHVQIAALTAIGSLVYLLAFRPSPAAAATSPRRRPLTAGRWLIAWVCAAGLFTVQWLPTMDYARLCTRVERGYADFVENSWNPASAIGFVLPMFFGQRTPNVFGQPYWGPSHQVEQFCYAGLLPLLLAGLALRHGWRGDPRRRPWVVLGAFGMLLALGTFGPVCPLLYFVPGSSLFRCPARALLLVNLAIAALAAVTLHDLGARLSPARARLRAAALRWTRRPVVTAAVVVTALPLLWLAGVAALLPLARHVSTPPLLDRQTLAAALHAVRPGNPAIWVPAVLLVAALVALRLVVRQWRRPYVVNLLVLLTIIDLGVVGWTVDVPAGWRRGADLLAPADADWMSEVAGSSQRLWVVTGRQDGKPGEYVDPLAKAASNTNILRGIKSLTDYGPLQPLPFFRRFGFKPWGESENPAPLLADTRWMRLYNVGWVLLCDDRWPPPADCHLATTTRQGWRLYRNPAAAGPVVFERTDQPGAVRVVKETGGGLAVAVDTWPTGDPGVAETRSVADLPRVVISRVALPGWQILVDGEPVAAETVDGVLLGVRVPPGRAAEITCTYCPPGLATGAAVSVGCAVLLLAAAAWCARRNR